MSSITTEKGILHYEVYGRGKPVILLHGWLGSVSLWQETMLELGKYYRTYSLDFWGFGESGSRNISQKSNRDDSMPLNSYAVQDFISMVDQFMEQLGILSAPLVGHSMGGTVSLSVAIQFPQRAEKVAVIGSPIVGSSLAMHLKIAGYHTIASLLFRFFGLFRHSMRIYSQFISSDPRLPAMMDSDLSKTTLDSFLTSITTLRRTDLRSQLHKIHVPVMGMYGNHDNIVHPGQWAPLLKGIPAARIERFPNAGHFIMLDEPVLFREKLKDFLNA